MAQHDYVIANGTGAAVRSDLNNGLSAIVTQNSGATEPATTYAFMRWADTTAGVMKMRNSANNAWITLYQLDGEWTNIAFENGTAAAPSIYFKDSGTDTGFYSPGTDQVGISTGGTARLTIDSNGNVNIDSNTLYVDASNNRVGLGTSSVNTKLEIAGSNDAVTENNTLRFTDTDVSTEANQQIGKIEFYSSDASTPGAGVKAYIGAFAADTTPDAYLAFATQDGSVVSTPVERLRITSDGKVGIGSNSPGSLLHVEGGQIYANRNGAGTQQVLQLNNSDTTAGTQVVKLAFGSSGTTKASINAAVYGNDYLTFNTGSDTERARIDSSGRLLVGTSSTSQACTIQAQGNSSTGTTGQGILKLSRGESSPANGSALGEVRFTDSGHTTAASIESYRDGGTWTSGSSQPTRLVFSTTADGASSPTERMRISNTGYIWAYSTSAGFLQNVSAAAGTSTALFIGNRSATATDGSGGTTVYYVWSNGNVQNTNGSYTAISDAKLKENIVDSSSQWNDLKAIQIRNWNFKAETGHETHRQIGPIAQELEQVCPGLVFETPDRDEEGNETGEVTKGVNQSVLYMKAVKALQEAMERIEALEAKVAALEGA